MVTDKRAYTTMTQDCTEVSLPPHRETFLTVRVTSAWKKELEAVAARREMSVSTLIRSAITELLHGRASTKVDPVAGIQEDRLGRQ